MLGLGLGITKTAGLRSLAQKLLSILRGRATYYENGAASKEEIQTISDYELLDKATILLTPTATSDARVHSVKTYTGDELVTDGDFSLTGTQAADTTGAYWTTGASWSIESGVASSDGGASYLTSGSSFRYTIGNTYKVSLEITERNSGSVSLPFDGTGSNTNYQDSIGVKTAYIVAGANNPIYIYSNSFDGKIDNLSIVDVSSDFDFDRASSATRINSSGLVQDMQSITDPELVLNGDFSEIDTTNAVSNPTFDLGDEEVTNGDFPTPNINWSLTNATIETDGARINNTVITGFSGISQLLSGTLSNKQFILTYDVVATNGQNLVLDNGTSLTLNTSTTGVGKELYFEWTRGDNYLVIKRGVADTDVTIDNVSVKEITDWDEVPAGWSFDGNGATHASGNTGILKQYNVTVDDNKTWKVQLKVNNVTSGTVIFESGDRESIGYGEGTHEFYHKNTTGNTLGLKPSSDFVGTIEYVNVFEVDPNDRWNAGNKWSISGGTANKAAGATSNISQAIDGISGKLQKVVFTVSNYGGNGGVGASADGSNYTENEGNGTFTEYITPNSNNLYIRASYSFVGSIDNVSVKEATFSDDVDLARINYDSNGENGHILLEPTSTNLFEYSESFNTAEWNRSAITVVDNSSQSPDGTNSASLMYPSSSGDFRYLHNSTIASSSKYTLSAFVKASGKNVVWMYINSGSNNGYIYYDLSDQTTQAVAGSNGTPTATIKSYANDWYKISFTTATSLSLNSGSGIGVCDAKGDAAVTVNGTDGVLVWGLQLEALSYATSYIPSLTGGTVTRAAETLTGSGNSTLINSTEGVLYAEINTLLYPSDFNNWLTITDGTANNSVAIVFETTPSITGRVEVGGVNQAYLANNVDYSNIVKVAVKYKANDFALWINGVEVATDTSGNTFSANTLNSLQFSYGSGTNNWRGKCKALAVFNEALTDDELELLTGVTNYGSFGELASANGYTII